MHKSHKNNKNFRDKVREKQKNIEYAQNHHDINMNFSSF